MYENIGFKSQKTELINNNPYEVELDKAIILNTKFNSFIEKEHEYFNNNQGLEFEKEKSKLNEEVNNKLRGRIRLIRQTSNIDLEESKAIKQNTLDSSLKKDDEITQSGLERIKNHDEEFTKNIYNSLIKIANGLGYKIKIISTENTWLFLEKNNLQIMLKYNIKPTSFGIGYESKIQDLRVQKQNNDGKLETVCYYGTEWLQACENISIQKDVDALIAFLG